MENGIGEACSEALASGERQDPCVRRLTDAALKETENTFAALVSQVAACAWTGRLSGLSAGCATPWPSPSKPEV